MSGAAGTLVGTIFLAVLRARQPLTARQIRATALRHTQIEHSYSSLTTTLAACTARGYLLKHPQPGSQPTYTVTPACSTPQGIRLQDILEAAQP